jgi:putative DNA primase/helicase
MSAADVAFALGGKANGSGWKARCPCHMDNNPSLSIGEGADGRVLLKCHAGCPQESLIAHVHKLGFDLSGKQRKPAGRIVAEYDYRDADRTLRYQVVRRSPKGFGQRQPDGKNGWDRNMDGVKRLPYRLPEMLAEPQKPIFIVEGEKDADRLTKDGLVATTSAGGAGQWCDELNAWFKDRDVVIVPDNDEAGRKHAAHVAHRLRDVARRIRIVELPGLPAKGDVSDWLHWQKGGHTWKDLRRLVLSAPVWHGGGSTAPLKEAASDDEARPPEYSDDALALRFSTAHGDDVRFVAAWGKWFLWETATWKVDGTLRAFDMSRTVCRAASAEIDDPKRVKLASSIASAKTVAAVVNLARVDRRHAATHEQWDADPWVFNTKVE